MAIKELNFPVIYNKNLVSGYGGNQEWFLKNWMRSAGCGSTSGANLAAYYAFNYPNIAKIYDGNVINFNQKEYLHVMEEMFTYMKPGLLGFPYIKKFAKKFILYSKKHGVPMEANILKKFKSIEETFKFVKKNIDANQPIALLILLHRAKELKESTWHWVTITGYVDNRDNMGEAKIIVSNYGRREMIDIDMIFEVHPKNKIRMVSFKIL